MSSETPKSDFGMEYPFDPNEDPIAETSAVDSAKARVESKMTRRNFGRAAAAGLGLSGAGVGATLFGSETAMAASADVLEAEDDEITTHDGSIDELVVDPSIAVEWEGFNDDETGLDITVEFKIEGDEESTITVYQVGEMLSGTHGDVTFELESKDLFEEGFESSEFEADENDSKNETVVKAMVDVEADNEESANAEDTFTVIVNNHPANVNVGGEITTSLESDQEVDE